MDGGDGEGGGAAGGAKAKAKAMAKENAEELVFLDEDLGPPTIADDAATERAAELTTDAETARELANAMARPPAASQNLVDRILAGEFPPWAAPVSTQSKSKSKAGTLEGAAEGPRVGDGHDVRLADGTMHRGAPGDGVAVASVDFDGAPPPGTRKAHANMSRPALIAALPTREAVVAAAVSAAATGGSEAADAILRAYGVSTEGEAEAARLAEATAKGAEGAEGRGQQQRSTGSTLLPLMTTTTTTGIKRGAPERRAAPEPMGDPEGKPPPECGAAAAAAQPVAAVRAFARWTASAKRTVRIARHAPFDRALPSNAANDVKKQDAALLGDALPTMRTEITRAHAFELEGADASADDAFDDAPDPLTAPPNRGEIASRREAALEREYRARSRDPAGTRWPAHETTLRDGAAAFPGLALDTLEAALIAERVLATKAAKYARSHPNTTRAEIDGIKLRQAPVHALAALAALAARAGIADAVQRLEPLMGGDRSVAKAYVDTIDLLPELKAPDVGRERAKEKGTPAPASPEVGRPPAARGLSTRAQQQQQQQMLVRFEGDARKRAREKQGKPSEAVTMARPSVLAVPATAKLSKSSVGLAAHAAALPALMADKKKSELVEQLLEQDAAWLDHVARHRIPLLMPDPALRDVLVADAAMRPPLPPHFDATAARKACAFDVARALHLPTLALQLGGREISVGAVRAAFARAHAFARTGEKEGEKEKGTGIAAPKMRAAEYARFEETTLMPWLERALKANAPTVSTLKARLGELRRESEARKDAALDALDPERYRGIVALQRIGAFDDDAFDRLVAENDADAAEANARPDGEKGDGDGDGDGYAMAGSDAEEEEQEEG